MKSSHRALLIAIALWMFVGTALAAGPIETVIYSFRSGGDGAHPLAGLVADHAGNLYGTTANGGNLACTAGCGTVFELAPAQGGGWTETVLYAFQGGNDAAGPEANLIFDAAGNLYGTTYGGGAAGRGTVFQLTRQGGAWVETVLYSFAGGSDGAYLVAPLIFDTKGNLYGTTVFGGGFQNAGIVFQLAPPAQQGGAWTETVLHSFGTGNDGIDPLAGVILDKQGAVYGTTLSGLVFKLTPPAPGHTAWTERRLYFFTGGGNNGSQPCSLLAGKSGVLYGTTNLGGSPANAGTVFQLAPGLGGKWTPTTLYSFTGGGDGGLACGRMVADQAGSLYGTTSGNGQNIPGTAFQLTPPAQQGGAWTETTLHDFAGGQDGFAPAGGVIFGKSGVLYGTTVSGGSFGNGTVYQIVP
jgi:uncharacterized repeat protein (TIGR03803 family)